MPTGGRSFLSQLWVLAKPYWVSDERWAARGLLALCVGLSLGSIYVSVLVNHWNAAFYNALQQFDLPEFLWQLGIFALLTIANVGLAVYQAYFRQLLQVRWRRWLTEHFVAGWLEDRAYYRMALQGSTDNPDQRISEDLWLFIVYTTGYVLGLLSSAVTLISFVIILWGLSGTLVVPLGRFGSVTVYGYMVWAALLYAIGGTWWTLRIGRPLVGLSFDQQRHEANFRFSLGRFRDHAESIALHRGEASERMHFQHRFADILRNYWAIMERQKRLTAFTWVYGQLALVAPILVAAPRYFMKQIQLGGLMQTAQAFNQVQGALSFVVNSYPDIARWQAIVSRMNEFHRHVQGSGLGAAERITIVHNGRPAIHIENLDVDLPSGQPLITGFGLTVAPGHSVFIAGPPGSGKTTLLRAISGIWPFGRGRIELPAGKREMIVPQKPYLPLGTLRDVLTHGAPSATGDAHQHAPAADLELRHALERCGLRHLGDRLDEERNWAQSLSLSEQTCLAFAHVLVQRPDLVFLDEATAGLDATTEATLYRVLREELPHATVISVGHRETLRALHDARVELVRAGPRSVTPGTSPGD